MSYADGWAALNLEMPPRVPHCELSAEWYHLPLVSRVTGMNVKVGCPRNERIAAASAFVKAWNFDIMFGSSGPDLSAKSTAMGHAEYAVDGCDFDDRRSCPFTSVEEVLDFDPFETYGTKDHGELVAMFNAHYASNCRAFPDCVNMTGVYTTLMSGMIEILGWDMLLLAAGTDQARFGELVNRYARWIQQYYNAVADSDTIAVYSHDDLVWTEGPFIHPDWYRTYIFPNLKKLWAPLVEAGKKVIFCCDGNYTQFLPDIAACGNAGFWFEIFTDLGEVVRRYGRSHVIIGNGDCRVLTFGSKADIRAEVKRCMDLGKSCPGYFMCISGHLPPNVPVENALYYYDAYNELGRR